MDINFAKDGNSLTKVFSISNQVVFRIQKKGKVIKMDKKTAEKIIINFAKDAVNIYDDLIEMLPEENKEHIELEQKELMEAINMVENK